MKKSRTLLVSWLTLALAWATCAFADQNGAIVFRGILVFDGESVLSNVTVIIQGRTIQAVAAEAPPPKGATISKGEGMTLLPGLIDAHVHNGNEPLLLRQAAVFGVTTLLNMFTCTPQADVQFRKEQDAGLATNRADLFTAGIGVTAKGGHGTQYGVDIPTLNNPADAQAFIDARIAEGSDYIKIILEPGELNRRVPKPIPTLSPQTAAAAVAAAKRRGKLAVFHVGNEMSARQALEAGADGLAHIYASGRPNWEIARLAKAKGAFVVPTLTVLESFMEETPGGASLADDPRLAPYIQPDLLENLRRTLPKARLGPAESYTVAVEMVRILKEVGVPILAGSDCDNIGTAHGVSLHRELELLVQAGLTPLEALRAATSTTAFR